MTLLSEEAIKRTRAVWKSRENFSSYDSFVTCFCHVFDHAPEGKEVSERLLNICQGKRRASEYALNFCIQDAESGWNETALQAVIYRGLKSHILTEIACKDESLTLDSLKDLKRFSKKIGLDNLSHDHSHPLAPLGSRLNQSMKLHGKSHSQKPTDQKLNNPPSLYAIDITLHYIQPSQDIPRTFCSVTSDSWLIFYTSTLCMTLNAYYSEYCRLLVLDLSAWFKNSFLLLSMFPTPSLCPDRLM